MADAREKWYLLDYELESHRSTTQRRASGNSIRAGKSIRILIKVLLTIGCIISAVGWGFTSPYNFGPEVNISGSLHPSILHTGDTWQRKCGARADTALYYAYNAPPKTPALTFPSRGTYEPISLLSPDDPAWPPAPSESQSNSAAQPVGVFIGLLCRPTDIARRERIRRSYRSSRWGGDAGALAATTIKFFVGQPKSEAEAAELADEMMAYNDIVVLPVIENLNRGKTLAFFDWAAQNATVPRCEFRSDQQRWTADCIGERSPDYVIKADMDNFLVLPAIEYRLRQLPRSKLYWGRMLHGYSGLLGKGDFMVGAGYGLSFDMVRYIGQSTFARSHSLGLEDERVSDWMRAHPEAEQVLWVSEECWMYEHPRKAALWSHGFLFPDLVRTVREGASLPPTWISPTESSRWSTTTPARKRYAPVSANMTVEQSAESLVEGSALSLLHPHNLESPIPAHELQTRIASAFEERRTKEERMRGWESGSTLWVHYAKEDELWDDAERAFLD